jgi:hypothetical protein
MSPGEAQQARAWLTGRYDLPSRSSSEARLLSNFSLRAISDAPLRSPASSSFDEA